MSTTFEIRGTILTEDGVRKYADAVDASPDALVKGFNIKLRGAAQHKLTQKEESALFKWLSDTKLFRVGRA